MKLTIITTILCLSSLLSLAQGGGDAQQEFKQRLESASDSNRTICCDFTQTKKVKNIKQPVVSRGQFYYDNKGLMALIYAQPKGDRVVMNGEAFVVVANGRRVTSGASSNPMMAQISYMMQACMSGDITKLGRGWSMSIERDGLNYRAVLTPSDRGVKRYISGMTMLFDAKDATLNELRIDERTGGYTQYNFINKRLNQPVDSSFFKAE